MCCLRRALGRLRAGVGGGQIRRRASMYATIHNSKATVEMMLSFNPGATKSLQRQSIAPQITAKPSSASMGNRFIDVSISAPSQRRQGPSVLGFAGGNG